MNVVIIKYNAGNIQSVLFALERIGVKAIVTDDHTLIRNADKVIFPGVGEASTAMDYLRNKKLDSVITSLKQPVLGICLGMQLLCSHSEENDVHCLSIFPKVLVKKFIPDDAVTKVPQIGWNNIYNFSSELFRNIPNDSFCYFVHGYYVSVSEHTIATTHYIRPYSSAIKKDNFYGVQFHPEKSAAAGEQLFKNFLAL